MMARVSYPPPDASPPPEPVTALGLANCAHDETVNINTNSTAFVIDFISCTPHKRRRAALKYEADQIYDVCGVNRAGCIYVTEYERNWFGSTLEYEVDEKDNIRRVDRPT